MQSRPVMSNMGLVFEAVNRIKPSLQSLVSKKMEAKYGKDYWETQVKPYNKKRNHPIREINKDNNDDGRACTRWLDVPYCLFLIEDYQLLSDINSKTAAMDKARKVRNTIFHDGRVEIEEKETVSCIESLIALAKCLDFDCVHELEELRDSASLPMHVEYEMRGVSKPDSNIAIAEKGSTEQLVNIATPPAETEVHTPQPKIMPRLIDEICIPSCSGFYDDLAAKQKDEYNRSTATAKTDVSVKSKHKDDNDDEIRLEIHRGMQLDDGQILTVDGKEFTMMELGVEDYNPQTKEIRARPIPPLRDLLNSNPQNIHLISDMKWLISRTEKFFEDFGGLVSYPPASGIRSPEIAPELSSRPLSNEQINAVKNVISSPLSYVWGVPGSGKTQSVLATSIVECVSRGEKVLVIAPTNTALEQVIEGLMQAFRDEPSFGKHLNPDADMLRIGVPTPEFLAKYPGICENRRADIDLDYACSYHNRLIEEASLRKIKCHEELFNCLNSLIEFNQNNPDFIIPILLNNSQPLMSTLSKIPSYSYLATSVDETNIVERIGDIGRAIYLVDHPHEPLNLSDSELKEEIKDTESKIENLKQKASKDIRKVKVLCMTLAKFIVTYGPFEYEGHKALEVSHVFLDEAGYCNCIQTLTLFSLHAPITLLGDHMQLPPVCEIDREQLKNQIDGDESHRYSFLWDMPAMTVDNFFDSTPDLLKDFYLDEIEPMFRFISTSKISTSYRFGQNLADILGKNVYGFEMKSKAEGPLELIVVDAPPTGFNEKNRNGSFYRYNIPEAEKVREIIKAYKLEDDDYIILTPYRNQIDCLKKKGVDRDRILTIHKSQGKEWDTVILSVCDCSLNPEDMKYRFTSTDPNKLESHGLRPINTAVSRAKKRLIIVCDYKYWSNQHNELIGEIVRTGHVD